MRHLRTPRLLTSREIRLSPLEHRDYTEWQKNGCFHGENTVISQKIAFRARWSAPWPSSETVWVEGECSAKNQAHPTAQFTLRVRARSRHLNLKSGAVPSAGSAAFGLRGFGPALGFRSGAHWLSLVNGYNSM